MNRDNFKLLKPCNDLVQRSLSQHTTLINIYKAIYYLPPEVLRLIYMFLGIGHFRFIGGTSTNFRELYLSVGADRTTAIENVVSSVPCVDLYLQEAGTSVAQLRVILEGAASYGRLDILEWAHQRGYSHACTSKARLPVWRSMDNLQI